MKYSPLFSLHSDNRHCTYTFLSPLFRELGYKTEQEHIRDCQLIEQRKRKQMLRIEEERTKIQQRQQELLAQGDDEGLEMAESKPLDELTSRDVGDLLGVEREEEEDEELAMARAIEEEQKEAEMNGAENEPTDECTDDDNASLEAEDDAADHSVPPTDDNNGSRGDLSNSKSDPITSSTDGVAKKEENYVEMAKTDAADPSSLNDNNEAAINAPVVSEGISKAPAGEVDDDATVEKGMVDEDGDDATVDKGGPGVTNNMPGNTEERVPETIGIASEEAAATVDDNSVDAVVEEEGADDEEEVEFDATNEEQEFEDSSKPKKPKNSAWQAMLKKEAEMLKKQKGKKSNGMLEMEADEEEDEEGVMGLEDFGFAAPDKKKDDDDEGDDQLDADDLENVVDELSDNEGDEEAGEAARRAAAAREEKERHKEIMRRMREGYDGRRGGVAGGSARGNLRFDQLVAADNREDAKRLGLLNEDEFDSDNEGGEGGKKEGDDEIEDETALLDQMLKDRFLQRDKEEELEENFSDDEEEEDPEGDGEGM